MKSTEKKKPVNTTPKGVWEGSDPRRRKGETQNPSLTTDLQGNGYPDDRKEN